ncbi:MAG: hypothetical protein VX610_09265 [SAR324 cluster bacterium]|nr:hypothetical protein [SAR324 cluster bacterium]
MKIDVTVKDNHQEFLNQVVRDYSLEGPDQAIQFLVKYSLAQDESDQIFGEIRCVGECFSADQTIPVKLEDKTVSKLKEIFQQHDFDDYDSEEEELGKVIRCMINFADQDRDLNEIFS